MSSYVHVFTNLMWRRSAAVADRPRVVKNSRLFRVVRNHTDR